MDFTGLVVRNDFFMQPFVRYLMKNKNGSAMVVFYIKLLIKASEYDGWIRYKGIKSTLAEELSDQLKLDRKTAEEALSAMVEYGYISKVTGQDYRVKETEYFTFDCD